MTKLRNSLLVTSGILMVFALVLAGPVQAQQTLQATEVESLDAPFSAADEFGRAVYLVRFAEPGLLETFRATRSPNERFDSRSPQMQAALADIRAQQQQHISAIGNVVGRSVNVTHHFTASQSGIAVRLTPDEARAVESLRNVDLVERERVYELDTFRGPDFIGADTIWSGASVPGGTELLGAGMVAGVLDSAVDISSPSFADNAACGHGDTAPAKVLSNLNCASTDVDGLCAGPPIAPSTHGTHVAGTVLGNFVDDTADPAPILPAGFTSISGVAPCASLRAYAVCPDSCPAAQIQAGMDSILLHGDVDVMSFSISGGTNPWLDNDRKKLDLVDAGIFVAASSGNTRDTIPNPVGNVNHRGPWVTSVAASTHDVAPDGSSQTGDVLAGFSLRGPTPAPLQNLQKPDITAPGVAIYAAAVGYEFSVTGPEPVPGGLIKVPMSIGSVSPLGSPLTDHPITFDPDQPPGEDGCVGFPSDFFVDSVALIQRGGCNFATKINNAAAAGADMVIIWNNVPGGFGMDTTGQDAGTPGFSISQAAGQDLVNFIVDNPNATIDYAGQLVSQYNFLSGTSMSSPHVVGAGLLVRQVHPDWTPVEVRSALQMTAHKAGTKENETTPWDADDVGSGRADLTKAALAGLVMHETFANFLAADPAAGGDVRTLNLAAMRDLDCSPQCSFTRTVRNTLGSSTNWSVSVDGLAGGFTADVQPATFAFTGDTSETQTLTFTFSANGDQTAAINFGEVMFVEAAAQSPDLHYTVALRGAEALPPAAEIGPDSFSFLLEENGSNFSTLTIANTGEADLTYNIDQAQPASVVLDMSTQPAVTPRDGQVAPISLVVDGFSGGISGIGVGGPSFLWFNRFTPGPLDLPFTLEEVDLLEATTFFNNQEGDVYDLYVWSSPDGDPSSGNEVLLTSVTGLTLGPAAAFRTITLPGGGVGIDASTGDILIGLVNRTPREGTSAAIGDSGIPSQGRSWIGFNFSGGVGNPPVLTNAGTLAVIDDLGFPRNWIIRGFGTGGSACLAPSDVSWLTVNPVAGTVAGSSFEEITVSVDMTGLGTGTFEARLCIETNDENLPVMVVPISVTVTAPEALTFDAQPADTEVGATLAPISVSVLDGFGEVDVDDNSTVVEISLETNPTGASLSGQIAVTAVNGVAVFNDLSIDAAGEGYRFQAVDDDAMLVSALSEEFDILQATSATTISMIDPANEQVVNKSYTVTISVTGFNPTGTVTVDDGTGDGSCQFDVETDSSCQLASTTVGVKTITASYAGDGNNIGSSAAESYEIVASGPAELTFSVQPNYGVEDDRIVPAIVVQVLDQLGELVDDDNSTIVELSLGTNPTGAALSGTVSLQVVNGEAVFTDLSIDLVGQGYQLQAVDSEAELEAVLSAEFDVRGDELFWDRFEAIPEP